MMRLEVSRLRRRLADRVNAVSERAYWLVFAIGMAGFFASIVWGLDSQSEVFVRDATQIPIFRVLLFLGIYAPVYVLNPKRRAGRDAVFCLPVMIVLAWVMEQRHDDVLNNIFVASFVPEWLARAILEFENPMWVMSTILGSALALLAINWLADRGDGHSSARARSLGAIVPNGLFVYLALTLSIWVVTHFLYVAGHTFYMRGYLRLVDQTTRQLDKVNRHDRLPLKGLVHAASLEEAERHFVRVLDETRADRKPMVKDAHELWRNTRVHGEAYIGPAKEYSESKGFYEFLTAVFNQRFHGYRDQERMFWFSRLSPPGDYNIEIVKHFFVYVRPSGEGGYWVLAEFNREFKDRQQGLFLIQFYLLFQVAFPLLLAWLWVVHRRRLGLKPPAGGV